MKKIKRIKCLFMVLILMLSVVNINCAAVFASDAKSILNGAELYPCKTGVVELDERVAEILAELRVNNKDTYSLMRAVYTYIIQNTEYGYSNEGVSDTMSFHKDPLYETAIPDYVINWSIDTIFDHQGICNSYNSAMIVFARAIGLEAYYFGGETHAASGGFTDHAWCEIKINGVFYVFDPNVDYSIYKANGSIMYLYFCKTEEEMKDKYKWYEENNQKYLSTFGEVKPESERITPVSYIYDDKDDIPNFDNIPLDKITDEESAVDAVNDAIKSVEQYSPTAMDYVLLYAEEAFARAATVESDDENIVIDDDMIEEAVNVTKNLSSSLNTIYNNSTRGLRKKVRVVVNTNNNISVDKKKLMSDVDSVTVVTPYSSIEFESDEVKNVSLSNEGSSKVRVTFDKGSDSNKVKVIFPNISYEGYNAVLNENNEAVGGKYNSITNEMTAKIDESGIYHIANNEKDFADIKDKAAEMQEAIKLLASKGIISGTSEHEFSPDSSISRAEVAAIILRTLSKLDPNADGGFADVEKADWFYGVAGSSKNAGIITGYEDNTFRGKVVIPKTQIVSVAARVLKEEMNYKDVDDAEYILESNYIDSNNIAQWAKKEVALATDVNMVIMKNNYRFDGDDNMTRGDAAVILKRLFDKVW